MMIIKGETFQDQEICSNECNANLDTESTITEEIPSSWKTQYFKLKRFGFSNMFCVSDFSLLHAHLRM